MKRTVSCEAYVTGNLLTNPTPVVTKGLNPLNNFYGAIFFLAYLDISSPAKERKANGATRQPFKKWRIE